uniref:Uncharacterized protein n=1 Tax=Anopheles farauti TaxID=69004 RepID=A0A182QPZ1_9DIPT
MVVIVSKSPPRRRIVSSSSHGQSTDSLLIVSSWKLGAPAAAVKRNGIISDMNGELHCGYPEPHTGLGMIVMVVCGRCILKRELSGTRAASQFDSRSTESVAARRLPGRLPPVLVCCLACVARSLKAAATAMIMQISTVKMPINIPIDTIGVSSNSACDPVNGRI